MALKCMNSVIKILLFVLLVISFSCEDQGLYTDCSDCTTTEPANADLEIKIKSTVRPVTINIYEGELEDGVLYISTVQLGTVYNTSVGLNKKYTVTATYNIDGNTYTAVDSAIPRVKFTETQCEESCYFVYDKKLDLRIKYTAK
jgi:hypothetical protein